MAKKRMARATDLFHQLVYESPEGFYAIADYTELVPHARVYTPSGDWCGSTDADMPGTLPNVKLIIKWRINYEKGQMQKVHEPQL